MTETAIDWSIFDDQFLQTLRDIETDNKLFRLHESYTHVPEGVYTVKLHELQMMETENSKPYLKAVFVISDPTSEYYGVFLPYCIFLNNWGGVVCWKDIIKLDSFVKLLDSDTFIKFFSSKTYQKDLDKVYDNVVDRKFVVKVWYKTYNPRYPEILILRVI